MAIIIDGNGRWAMNRGLQRKEGHKEGCLILERILKHIISRNIKYTTIYAFSTENWKRNFTEVNFIMNLIMIYLKKMLNDTTYTQHKVNFIGEKAPLNSFILDLMKKIQNKTKDKKDFVLNFALNYGSQLEILCAFKNIYRKIFAKELSIDTITTEDIDQNLYTAGQVPPDLIIRTGGEKRISNFLLWQSAYAEYAFTDVLWPDFNEKIFDDIVDEFFKRERRFGGILNA